MQTISILRVANLGKISYTNVAFNEMREDT